MNKVKNKNQLQHNINFSLLYLILFFILIVSIIFSITMGSVTIKSSWVWKIVVNKIFDTNVFNPVWSKTSETIVWMLRLPRILLAAVVGAGLSLSGVLMQALTKNSLADPYILGISSGASTGAVLSIIVGAFSFMGQYGLAFGAFIGALFSTFLVFKVSTFKNRFTSTRLVLSGVAIAAMFSSITSFIVFRSKNVHKLYSAMFWMTGSFSGTQWEHILLPTLAIILSIIIIMIFNKALDALLLGEDTAITLGVNTKRLRKIIISISTLLTGFMVAFSGIIGFVGLVIPHIVRTFAGSKHKKIIPISALLGAIFLVWTDILARIIVSPEELPIGIVTSFFGAPFFLWLLRKSSYSFGGKR